MFMRSIVLIIFFCITFQVFSQQDPVHDDGKNKNRYG